MSLKIAAFSGSFERSHLTQNWSKHFKSLLLQEQDNQTDEPTKKLIAGLWKEYLVWIGRVSGNQVKS